MSLSGLEKNSRKGGVSCIHKSYLAGAPGFEPRSTASKAGVLTVAPCPYFCFERAKLYHRIMLTQSLRHYLQALNRVDVPVRRKVYLHPSL